MQQLEFAFWSIGAIIVCFYTVFAPEAFFHNTKKRQNSFSLERWNDKRLEWNMHQSFIHFVGSTIGVVCLHILFFKLGIGDPAKYDLRHLSLLLFGIAGIMGMLPKIFFESIISGK